MLIEISIELKRAINTALCRGQSAESIAAALGWEVESFKELLDNLGLPHCSTGA